MSWASKALLIGIPGLAVLAVWQALSMTLPNAEYLLAGPWAVLLALGRITASGDLAYHLSLSLAEYALGFGSAVIVAIPMGLLLGGSKRVEAVVGPYVGALYAMPRIALFPLIALWFGLGIQSRTVLVFSAVFFPVCLNTWAGVSTVDAVLVRAARSFCCSRMQIYRKVVLPFVLPYILAGARIGAGLALLAVYVAELFAGNRGIGYFINQAGTALHTDEMLAGIVVISLLGIVLTQLVSWLERRLAPWRGQKSALAA
jgi:NitT/TauT family transport system permease protein